MFKIPAVNQDPSGVDETPEEVNNEINDAVAEHKLGEKQTKPANASSSWVLAGMKDITYTTNIYVHSTRGRLGICQIKCIAKGCKFDKCNCIRYRKHKTCLDFNVFAMWFM